MQTSAAKKKIRIKPGDIPVFILAAFMLFFFVSRTFGQVNTDLKVYVKVKKDEYVYPLEKNSSLVLDGLLGPVVLNIEGGEAWIEESSCPDKLCMKMGRIDESGEWLACLPNKIFIRISGDDE